MSDKDVLMGGLIGYLMGTSTYAEWKGFIDKVGERIGHTAFMKIIVPQGLFSQIPSSQQVYAEAIRAFSYGLPNASIPILFKCLELGLKKKYTEIEKKSPDKLDNNDLINWAEKFLGSKKELAQGFRILRNLLHYDALVPEPEALQAIYNGSNIMNALFPYEKATIQFRCMSCKGLSSFQCSAEQNFLGNVVVINCNNCRTAINFRIFI